MPPVTINLINENKEILKTRKVEMYYHYEPWRAINGMHLFEWDYNDETKCKKIERIRHGQTKTLWTTKNKYPTIELRPKDTTHLFNVEQNDIFQLTFDNDFIPLENPLVTIQVVLQNNKVLKETSVRIEGGNQTLWWHMDEVYQFDEDLDEEEVCFNIKHIRMTHQNQKKVTECWKKGQNYTTLSTSHPFFTHPGDKDLRTGDIIQIILDERATLQTGSERRFVLSTEKQTPYTTFEEGVCPHFIDQKLSLLKILI